MLTHKIRIKSGQISKKAVKRILRKGEKAKCILCQNSLRKSNWIQNNQDVIRFYCQSFKCRFSITITDGEVVAVTDPTSSPTGLMRSWLRPKRETLSIELPRLRDQFYNIVLENKECDYNPVSMMLRSNHILQKVTQTEHHKLCNAITQILCHPLN